MYKQKEKLNVTGGVIITNQSAFFIKVIDGVKRIVRMDKCGTEHLVFDFIDIIDVEGLAFTNDYFMISFKSGTTFFYSMINGQKVFHFNEAIYFSFLEEDTLYMYIKNKVILYRFNKSLQCIEKFSVGDKNLLLRCVLDNNIVFTLRGYLLVVYKNRTDNVILSWQLDIRSLFPEQEDVEIRDIKEYQGSLIVATTAAVLRLSVEDGSIIWISEGYARTIEIVGNTGYVCTSGSLFKVNLDNGEESGFGWGEYHKLPNFTYNGKDYWATGHRVVYHDGLLWYSVYSSGDSFLIAINPENGNYEWIHYVDTIGKTDEPQFFGDYMFLYDTERTLHIYQKES